MAGRRLGPVDVVVVEVVVDMVLAVEGRVDRMSCPSAGGGMAGGQATVAGPAIADGRKDFFGNKCFED